MRGRGSHDKDSSEGNIEGNKVIRDKEEERKEGMKEVEGRVKDGKKRGIEGKLTERQEKELIYEGEEGRKVRGSEGR